MVPCQHGPRSRERPRESQGRGNTMKRWFVTGAALGLAFTLALAGPAAAQKTKLTIYTSLENDQLGPFKQAIATAVPEAAVERVRDSTGIITARFLAEKDNPRA